MNSANFKFISNNIVVFQIFGLSLVTTFIIDMLNLFYETNYFQAL